MSSSSSSPFAGYLLRVESPTTAQACKAGTVSYPHLMENCGTGSVECLVQGLSLQVAEPRSVLNELSTLSGTMDNGTMEGAQWTWITILAEVVCILTSMPMQQAPCPGWADLAAGAPWCQLRLSSWSVMVTDGWGLLRLRDWWGKRHQCMPRLLGTPEGCECVGPCQ